MHGIIFREIRKYADERLPGKWDLLLAQAGLASRVYDPIGEYPDGEAVALFSAVARTQGASIEHTLEDYGEYIAPHLIALYRPLLKKHWRTLDVLENTEATIHKVVRTDHPAARPPKLYCRRISPDEVVISYTSVRKLCAVAKGIARGVASYFDERIAIAESQCMLTGGDACEISVRRTAKP